MNVCRICVREQDPLKDLLEANNTSTCKIVEKFTQKSVSSRDELSTKICLNCEEKFVTFELFLLECQKAQEDFLKTLTNTEINITIKVEKDDGYNYSVPTAFEVKTEVSEDQYIQQSNSDQNDGFGNDYDDDDDGIDDDGNYDDGNDDDGNDDDGNDDDGNDGDYRNSSDYDEMDEIAISSLKKIMSDDPEQKDHIEDIVSNALEELYQLPRIQSTDIVKFNCHHCGKKCQNWPRLKSHCITEHQVRPQVFCVCGSTITTRSGIYAHLTKHKTKHKQLKCGVPRSGLGDGKKYGFRLSKYIDFSCRLCQGKYYGWFHLKRHYDVKHKGQRLVVHCSCGRELQSKTMVYRHVEDHENPGSHRCEICQKVYRTLDALEKHKIRHIPKPDRRYNCRVCDKEFKTRDGMKSHEKSHIPIENRKVFHCDICNMKFTAKSTAMMHRRTKHEKVKTYVCDLCGFTCATGGELKQHRAIHSDEKPFQCEKCNKRFKTYANYKTHTDIHEGTSYPCYLCNRVLNSRRTLRKHLVVHEDQCKHVCSYCGKAFKRRQTLVAHLNIHTGDKPITCKICGDKFAYASTLRSHRIRVHPELCQPKDRPNPQPQILEMNQ